MKKIILPFTLLFIIPLYFLTKSDFNLEKVPVQILIFGGRIISPEGSMLLDHYVSGEGGTLELPSDYLRNSPVVKKAAENLKIGQTRRITFDQSKDWRLSYALNPFNIKRTKNGFEIYQWIQFDKTNKVYTYLNLGFTKIKVYDNMVHVYECKPFMAKCFLEKI